MAAVIPVEKRPELVENAAKIVAPGKGILAADESTGTIGKRFSSISLENTEENRRRYRELLFTTEGVEKYLGGVIFFDETLRQKASSGKPFVQIVAEKGIVPGIKIDLVSIPFLSFLPFFLFLSFFFFFRTQFFLTILFPERS